VVAFGDGGIGKVVELKEWVVMVEISYMCYF